MESTAVTAAIATWINELHPDDIPQHVRRQARLLILDTLGAEIQGRDQPWAKIISSWAHRGALQPYETGLASEWGSPRPSLRPGDAALINGSSAHAFELDDFHNAKVHPGSVVIPASFAIAEAFHASGADLEASIIIGYEVMVRTSLALNPSSARLRGWHLTSVCGTFGAAAAASKLLGLDAEHTGWALALAGTQSGGLFMFSAGDSTSKSFHAGRAAQSGILAAELAELGLSSSRSVYESQDGGFLKAFSECSTTKPLSEGLGTVWRFLETNFKPYSCCGSIHSHIDAALALRQDYREGAQVRVGMAQVVYRQCGYDYEPGTALNAQMSVRYCIAAALLDGAVLPEQFTPERIACPAIATLATSIEMVHDYSLDSIYPEHFIGWVEIESMPGQFRRIEISDPSGSPVSPFFEKSLRAKFHTLADPVLGASSANRLEEVILRLDRATPEEIINLLVKKT